VGGARGRGGSGQANFCGRRLARIGFWPSPADRTVAITSAQLAYRLTCLMELTGAIRFAAGARTPPVEAAAVWLGRARKPPGGLQDHS
jgi:hypothetical protein